MARKLKYTALGWAIERDIYAAELLGRLDREIEQACTAMHRLGRYPVRVVTLLSIWKDFYPCDWTRLSMSCS
jgi:hypothetical protein